VTRHLSNYLFCLAVLISLAGCYLPPNYAYGNLFVLTSYTSDSYSVEVGACKGEILTLRWNVGEGKNPTLMASPTQNIEPQLPSRVANSGEIQVTFKDNVTISFTIDGGQDYETERRIVAIPEGVCTGFPLELRGAYAGTLEQTVPQVASLPHRFVVRWNDGSDTLRASLVRSTGTAEPPEPGTIFEMTCIPLDREDTLTCVYDPAGDVFLRLEGTVNSTGYEGTYQGVLEGATFQTSTSGTFKFIKQ
jgi:hypothetical protein